MGHLQAITNINFDSLDQGTKHMLGRITQQARKESILRSQRGEAATTMREKLTVFFIGFRHGPHRARKMAMIPGRR